MTEDELLQIDAGIGMDDVSDSHHTGKPIAIQKLGHASQALIRLSFLLIFVL